MSKSKFSDLLLLQIGNEFAASQQYIAVAVWFANQDLPQLARYFYRQSVEERNHAMMMVQYMLDRGASVNIPGVPAVRNDFTSVTDPLSLALQQEKEVTRSIESLFRAARAEGRHEPTEAYAADALAELARGAGAGATRSRAKIIVRVDLAALLQLLSASR